MHPAKSVIFFTTASGAGYGLFVWLALFGVSGLLEAETVFGLVGFGLAFSLIISGLVSSTFHLGHPERAWRAMSQWRTSWLSREGLAAVITFIPGGLFGLAWVFLNENGSWATNLGLLGAIMAMVTVYCTAMIYGSLKAIPSWYTGWTRVAYLTFSLMTGAVLLWVITVLFDLGPAKMIGLLSLLLLAAGLFVKLKYWRVVDGAAGGSTIETATGLGKLGKVALIEAPHGQDNYLLKEMGFAIARKHSARLRQIAIVFGFIVPFLGVLIGLYVLPQFDVALAVLTVIIGTIGIACERWLFFAEAKHVMNLYYGVDKI